MVASDDMTTEIVLPGLTPRSSRARVQQLSSSSDKFLIKIRSIKVKKLPSLEMFGKNDPYVSLSFGDNDSSGVSISSADDGMWKADTSVQDGAGANANWVYGDDDESSMQLAVSGIDSARHMLVVRVMEYNKITAHGFLGSTEMQLMSVLQAGMSQTLSASLKDKKGKPNGGSIEIMFEVSVYVPPTKVISFTIMFYI